MSTEHCPAAPALGSTEVPLGLDVRPVLVTVFWALGKHLTRVGQTCADRLLRPVCVL